MIFAIGERNDAEDNDIKEYIDHSGTIVSTNDVFYVIEGV